MENRGSWIKLRRDGKTIAEIPITGAKEDLTGLSEKCVKEILRTVKKKGL